MGTGSFPETEIQAVDDKSKIKSVDLGVEELTLRPPCFSAPPPSPDENEVSEDVLRSGLPGEETLRLGWPEGVSGRAELGQRPSETFASRPGI